MKLWDVLAEAKIREWLERRRKEAEEGSPSDTDPADSDKGGLMDNAKSIEMQLFDEALEARRAARATDDPAARDALVEKSKKAQIRLMVILEKNGFPLLAKSLQDRLDAADE
jgi:hypothetical protein